MPKLKISTWILSFVVAALVQLPRFIADPLIANLVSWGGCLLIGVLVAVAYTDGYRSAWE